MRTGGVFVQLRDEETTQILELNYYPPENKYYEEYVEGSELDHLAFWCKDVRRNYERVLAGGATTAIEPWDESGYTLAFVKDPDGIWIELIGKKVRLSHNRKKSYS
jgi:catechol 2,3-dioxygenase-like lactoylglutathione lyase family enzyme